VLSLPPAIIIEAVFPLSDFAGPRCRCGHISPSLRRTVDRGHRPSGPFVVSSPNPRETPTSAGSVGLSSLWEAPGPRGPPATPCTKFNFPPARLCTHWVRRRVICGNRDAALPRAPERLDILLRLTHPPVFRPGRTPLSATFGVTRRSRPLPLHSCEVLPVIKATGCAVRTLLEDAAEPEKKSVYTPLLFQRRNGVFFFFPA